MAAATAVAAAESQRLFVGEVALSQRLFVGEVALSPTQLACAATLARGLVVDMMASSTEQFRSLFHSIQPEYDPRPACTQWNVKDAVKLCDLFGAAIAVRHSAKRVRSQWALRCCAGDACVEVMAATHLLRAVLATAEPAADDPLRSLVLACRVAVAERVASGRIAMKDLVLPTHKEAHAVGDGGVAARQLVVIRASSDEGPNVHPCVRQLRSTLLGGTDAQDVDTVLALCVDACALGGSVLGHALEVVCWPP